MAEPFKDINILGAIERDEGQFAIGGWEGMVVLQLATGKRVYLKRHAIRVVEEV